MKSAKKVAVFVPLVADLVKDKRRIQDEIGAIETEMELQRKLSNYRLGIIDDYDAKLKSFLQAHNERIKSESTKQRTNNKNHSAAKRALKN
jgi:hypothetical protein